MLLIENLISQKHYLQKDSSYLIQKFGNLTKIIIMLLQIYITQQRREMSNNELRLPPINQKVQSTLKLPNDNDLLLDNDTNMMIDDKNMKIWDKKTASCRSKLKRFDNYQTAIDDKYVPINSFNQKEKKIIENAMQIIQMRKKNKDLAGKNQTIVEILQQKKQMFLVTMTHGIIEKEIQNLTSQAEERSKALQESNQILEKDKEDFEQYYEKYKTETKKIEEQFEKQVQKRLAKQQQIKNRQITVNSLRTLKVRNEEAIASALRYKNFLNQLPPKQWVDEQQARKKKKLSQIRQRVKTQWVMSGSSLSKKSNTSQEDFDRYFQKLLESGENEQIQEIMNDQQMYFKEASQLIQFFNTLEENNLFNIQNSHLAEQKYQQLKVRSQQKKAELKSIHEVHKQQKKQLEKQFNDLKNQISLLHKKKEQNSLLDQKDNKDIKATITQQYDSLKQTIGASKDAVNPYLPNLESKNSQSLVLLSAIQICMERLWQKLRQCYAQNPKLIKEIRTQLQKKKNSEKRQQAAKNNKMQEQKRKNRNSEKKQPTLKITGRIDMKRSPPQDKLVVKKIETSDKDIDDDRKYLVD